MDSNILESVLITIATGSILFALYIVTRKLFPSLVNEFSPAVTSELYVLRDKVSNLESEVERLEGVVATLINHITELAGAKQANALVAEQIQNVPEDGDRKRLNAPALLLVAGDNEMASFDRISIKRSGLRFRRLRDATYARLAAEMRRRRFDGNLYRIVHFSAHGSDEGIELQDGTASPGDLVDILQDVEIVFLSTCSNVKIADALAGVADYVISVYEEISNDLASAFAASFYKSISNGKLPGIAFDKAIYEVPEVSEYVDIRMRS